MIVLKTIGFVGAGLLVGCSTLKDSVILSAGTGLLIGAVAGAQAPGDRGENSLKGGVLGGVLVGFAGYAIHQSLEKRDDRVRRETLMNLEHYEVLGFDKKRAEMSPMNDGRCYTSQEVDGRIVSIPCRYLQPGEVGDGARR